MCRTRRRLNDPNGSFAEARPSGRSPAPAIRATSSSSARFTSKERDRNTRGTIGARRIDPIHLVPFVPLCSASVEDRIALREDTRHEPPGRNSQKPGRGRIRPGAPRASEPPDHLCDRSRNVRSQYRSRAESARELEVTSTSCFRSRRTRQKTPESLAAEVLSGRPRRRASRCVSARSDRAGSACRSARRLTTCRKPTASSSGRSGQAGRADLVVFAKDEAAARNGWCLPGATRPPGLLARMVEKISGVEIVSAAASSKLALTWLSEGKVHIAGSHLEDPKTGEFNLPYLRKQFPDEDFSVVTFARWEEGLVVAAGNPKTRSQDRRSGAEECPVRESRARLGKPRAAGPACWRRPAWTRGKVQGYDRIAHGHLAAAYCVMSRRSGRLPGDALRRSDVRAGFHSAAQRALRPGDAQAYRGSAAVKAFLDVLQRATLRRKLEVLAGYDTSQTGSLVA